MTRVLLIGLVVALLASCGGGDGLIGLDSALHDGPSLHVGSSPVPLCYTIDNTPGRYCATPTPTPTPP